MIWPWDKFTSTVRSFPELEDLDLNYEYRVCAMEHLGPGHKSGWSGRFGVESDRFWKQLKEALDGPYEDVWVERRPRLSRGELVVALRGAPDSVVSRPEPIGEGPEKEDTR